MATQEAPRTPAYAVDQFVAVSHKRGIVVASGLGYCGRTDSRYWSYQIHVMDESGDVIDSMSAPEEDVRPWVGPRK